MNNQERDKFLTKTLGECWHEVVEVLLEGYPVLQCAKCSQYIADLTEENFVKRINFSTWEGFGKLWEWSRKQKWFQLWLFEQEYIDEYNMAIMLINPDRFADAVYEYLKSKE